jgi:hypothetical protein
MEPQVSKIYLYRDSTTGELSLIMHHSAFDSFDQVMSVDFNLEGVPEGATTALSDDIRLSGFWEFNLDNEPEGSWIHNKNSDGGIVGQLPTDEPWCITVNPNFIQGIDRWEYQTPGGVIGLDMNTPLTICAQPAVVGNECHFGIVGIPVEGGWKGQGSFVDKDYRLKAHLTVEDGSSGTSIFDGSPYVILTGTARLSINNEKHCEVEFRVSLIDVPTGEDRFFIRFFGHNVYSAWSGLEGLDGGEIVIH